MAAQIGQYAYPPLRSMPDPYDQITPPCGIVMPGQPYVKYGTTLEGADGFGGTLGQGPGTAAVAPTDFTLDYLIVLSHASTLERIEQNLDAWLGFENDGVAVSVAAAVAVDPTLGKTVAWCVPVTADRPGPLQWNGAEAFGTRIHFQLSAL
jgi:hypothetical protein